MNNRTIAIIALVASLALALAGCGLATGGYKAASETQKVSVSFSVPSINPYLEKALGNAVAPAASASRAMLMLSSYQVSLYDPNTYTTTYQPAIPTTSQGPGGSNYQVDLQLNPNQYYGITIYGYNAAESASAVVSGYSYVWINQAGSMSGPQEISISMTPYLPAYLDTYTGAYTTDNWYDSGHPYSSKPSVYIGSGVNGTFTYSGGEKWLQFNAPYSSGNTASITIAPADPSVVVFAALYDENGNSLGGMGLSPSFAGGSTNAVTLDAGINPYYYVYIGYVLISRKATVTAPDPVLTNGAVTITYGTPRLTDDNYDNNDTKDAAYYLNSYSSGTPIQGLKAYDQDWYYVWFDAGTHTVSVDTSFDATGSVEFTDNYGMSRYNIWTAWDNTTKKAIPQRNFTYTWTITSSGYYYIGVNLNGWDINMDMPTLGDDYSLTITN